MRIHPIPLITGLLLFAASAFSQKDPAFTLQLRSGTFVPQKNLSLQFVQEFNKVLPKVNGKSFAVLQFEQIPTESDRKQLAAAGIELLDYIPDRAYTVSLSRDFDYNLLQSIKARTIFQLAPEQKMHPQMAKGIYPSWAMKSPDMIDVWISFPRTVSFDEIKQLLNDRNIEITSTDYKNYRVIGLKIPVQRTRELASYPFIDYVEPAPHDDQMLNFESRNDSRGNVLNAASGVGGFDLKGDGIVVGVGDDADVQYHVDFTGRLINFGPAGPLYHGTHVHGTVGGAGNLLQEYQGYAPHATLVSQYSSDIIKNAPVYVNDYGMVITNNSYGSIVGDCNYAGTYDLESRVLDLMAFSSPNLQHVFAAGNDGDFLNCSPYPAGFKTVVGGYQTAKNVLTVGATLRTGVIASFSSRGPVKDGRTKPEVTADGSSTRSTIPGNNYGGASGTSMSCPAVAGGLALLYERYGIVVGGTPKSGLMKALLCNGASEQGNTGPDYTYGFGGMNLLRSVDMLNNSRYFISTISNGGTNTHTISVPAGTAQLKVMLYWHDPAAALPASQTLVNDLDLDITSPGSVLPWKLDTVPANVNNAATTAADHINNIEQVTIINPASGNHSVRIQGTSVPIPSQEYFVVYDIIPTETKIVYPIGGEGLNPGETATIQWESYGDPANTFTVEYSVNNGGSWTTINNNVAANLRQLSWVVPSVQTEQALVRVTRNGAGYISTSAAFTILGIPTLTLASTQCEGYFAINWTAVTGATDYEVFKLQGTEMVSVATTTLLTYTFSGLSPDSVYWLSVRARVNGGAGRRAFAISRQPNTGTCAGSISDNDLRMDSITAPVSGRLLTSTALTASTSVSARIKNLDDANVTSFKIRYYVGGSLVVEDAVSATVAAGATYTHTFSVPYNFSAASSYILKAEVENTTGVDPVTENNSRTDTIRQLNNDPIPLPFIDNLETASARMYYEPRFGVAGIDRYDFTNTHYQGRLSTFLSSGMAYSGTKSLMLDLDGYNGATGNTNFVYGTYNLNGINASVNDMRLDFQFKTHGDSVVNANNKVWIRGDDTQTWIEAFTLSANENTPGVFKKTPSLEIADLLVANGQNFSSSFQVKWGQFGVVRIRDNEGTQGHNIDDIRIYEAIDDIQLISIDSPLVNSCALSSTTTVTTTIRNSSSVPINNIPIRLVVDGVPIATETITLVAPGIASNTTYQYTFTATANLASLGNHTLLVDVEYPTDNFRDNDTATLNIINSPLINTFPYVENFESGNGSWYSGGKNNSWEYGTPAATKINRVASGIKAWKTKLDGSYNSLEASYLYSPCYDISSMSNPTLSFNIALDLEDCGGVYCDGAYVEYSSDGSNWTRLGSSSGGINWYNRNYGAGNTVWSVQNYTRWHVVTTSLPTGISKLRLRIVVESDPFVNYEGVGVDDIHIYNNTDSIYNGATMGSPVSQTISGGTSWIDFKSSGKLVASVQPNNQNLGNTDVQAYINTAAVRNDSRQYYHNRNITIKPANTALSDSAIVRFYFLENETEALINATGCALCTKPAMAAELGVTKYSDPDDNLENGSLADDILGTRIFLSPDWNYKVPFDKGYYIEFKVKDFSEFWLSNGWTDKQTPLPVGLLSFNARKKDAKDVLVEWKTVTEYNLNRFEIEVAKGNVDYQNRRFIKIGEIPSPGNSTSERSYNFTDAENGKNGVRYYRLKIVDNDNTFVYSPVRPVVFSNEVQLQVYPNPSNGIFNLIYQLNQGETMTVKVYDINGKLIKRLLPSGNGFVQKTIIDLHSSVFAPGIYLLKVERGEKLQQFKLIKQ
ncbi:MAG: T9SS type A sorting domain-containing protein [Chitinophagaceae bacterium]|nr:MAG: T9SS type A sorting domain-containing protein [Chitinophagaceae bacterium]